MSSARPRRLTRAEVRARLTSFSSRWDRRPGHERQEAQQFLLELLSCYGVDTTAVPAPFTFEHRYSDGSRADLFWPGFLLAEMKSAGETERLQAHRPQALGYWRQSADPKTNTPSPRWLIVCSFRRMEVWQPGEYPQAPRATVDLIDLPDRLEVLDFLRGQTADFDRDAADLAGEAVDATAGTYRSVVSRGTDPLVARDFVLQAAWCMFAEDLDLLPDDNFSRAVETIRGSGLSSYDHLGDLFEWLSRAGERPSAGAFEGVPFVNGGLFAWPARLDLTSDEVDLLARACSADWSLVEPSIFGGLLQSSLGADRRKRMSAFYTPEAEIEKIVGPTIVAPWEMRIDSLDGADEALDALSDLATFRVLDPACGCGNFLYVAYRELRRLESLLRDRVAELHRSAGRSPPVDLPSLGLSNMLGIEKDPFAAALARVVLWIGHKRAVDLYGVGEDPLPLPDLEGIVQGDALKLSWPSCDAIVGNPPFHGTKLMRGVLGDEEIAFLDEEFGVGVKDYCVYWFRKTQDHLSKGQHAGLVATNSIAEGKNREASLDYVISSGGKITNAVRSQPWPGEANVHVSIVNWVKGAPSDVGPPILDGIEVEGITSELRPGTKLPNDAILTANRGRQFFGVVPSGDGFILSEAEAASLLANTEADYAEVVRRYLTGDDITTSVDIAPTRWIIDFGERTLEEAERWPEALAIVRARVKPQRDGHGKRREREQWWKHSRSVRGLFAAVAPLTRFIACPATSRRLFMVWCAPAWCPSNLTSVFAFDDDYSHGVLQSRVHTTWAVHRSTKLKSDARYTVRSFGSFPWPDQNMADQETISTLAAAIEERRRELCRKRGVGLNKLYNALADGVHVDLTRLHDELDRHVAAAYGWPAGVENDDEKILIRLSKLNRAISSGKRPYAPFETSRAETTGLFGTSAGTE